MVTEQRRLLAEEYIMVRDYVGVRTLHLYLKCVGA